MGRNGYQDLNTKLEIIFWYIIIRNLTLVKSQAINDLNLRHSDAIRYSIF